MPDSLKILLVSRDDADRREIERIVRDGRLSVQWANAETAEDAIEKVKLDTPDLMLVCYTPDVDLIWPLLPRFAHIPVIAVVAKDDETVIGEALRRGAHDGLVKDSGDLFRELLLARIRSLMERKRVQEALKESEARYQDIFNHAPDMYFILTPKGVIQSANKTAADQLGYALPELIGRSLERVLHPKDGARVLRELRRTADQPDRLHQMEFRAVRRDGSEVHIGARMQGQAGVPERLNELRVVCRDISAQKLAEERETILRDRLARTERLESLAILAGGVAHDLNNVLMPLVAYPDLLLGSFSKNSREYADLQEIKRSAVSAAEIVRDLLTMARRGKYEMATTDVNELIRIFMGSPAFRELNKRWRDVNVEVELIDAPWSTPGSSPHLNKVLMNLVYNACEAMPKGGTLTIKTENRVLARPIQGYETVPEGEHVVVSIGDTGTGIKPVDLARIFEPFYSKKKLGRSGTGLGLSVVYGVVKDHGGFVDVQSDEKQGSRFVLYLPRGEVSVKTSTPVADRNIEGSESILVVDDLPEQRDVAKRLLTRLGYKVTTASGGREAVELSRAATNPDAENPFDLALLDMVMEDGFDGLDTLNELRHINPTQKAIVVSGYAETDRVNEALAKGAGGFVRKPYTLHVLGRAVRDELDRTTDSVLI